MNKRAFRAMGFIVAGTLLWLCTFTSQVLAEIIRLGVVPTPHCAVIYLAETQGFFKKHGADVVIRDYEAGALAVNDLIADKIDMVTGAEFVFVLQSFKQPDLRMLATFCMATDQTLVVRKDRAISRPQDLKGKRIAVTRGSSAEFFLHNYLISNRIPAQTIQVVYQGPSEMVKAMADGTIDAALCWPRFASQMEKQLGAKVARWPAQSGQDYYFALFAKEGFLRKHPKTMEQCLSALLEAELFIAKNSDRAQTLLRQRLGLDAASFNETWSRARFEVQLTQDLLVLMEREAKWAIRNKLVEKKEMPNFLDFFYFDALDKVKPEAVGVIH